MSQYSNIPQSINQPNNILDLERYNGRVNIMQPPDQKVQFKMIEKITLDNKSTDYRTAVTGLREETTLSRVFFCAENITLIQNDMRVGVYNMSKQKYMVPPQNINNLKTIMRSIFLEHSREGSDVTSEVGRINKLVLDYVVPSVYNSAVSYDKYRQDQSSLVVPLDLPKNHDRDYKQLEVKQWF